MKCKFLQLIHISSHRTQLWDLESARALTIGTVGFVYDWWSHEILWYTGTTVYWYHDIFETVYYGRAFPNTTQEKRQSIEHISSSCHPVSTTWEVTVRNCRNSEPVLMSGNSSLVSVWWKSSAVKQMTRLSTRLITGTSTSAHNAVIAVGDVWVCARKARKLTVQYTSMYYKMLDS